MSNVIRDPEFSEWAFVDLMGHVQRAGKVDVVYFGEHALIRITTPKVSGRAWIVEEGFYHQAHGQHIPEGTRVSRTETPELVRFVGVSAIYELTVAPEAEVLKRIEAEATLTIVDWPPDYVPDPF